MSYYLMKVNQQKNPSRVSSYLKENSLEGGVINWRNLWRPNRPEYPEEELEYGPNELDLPINTNVRIKPPPQNIIDELNEPIEENIRDLPPPIRRDLRNPRQILVGPDVLDKPTEEKVAKKPFHSIFNFNPPLDNDTLLENLQKLIAEKGEEDGINFGEYKVFFKWYSQEEKKYFFIVIKNKIDPYRVSCFLRLSQHGTFKNKYQPQSRNLGYLRYSKRDEIEYEDLGHFNSSGGVTFSFKNGYLVTVTNRGYVSINNKVNLPQQMW